MKKIRSLVPALSLLIASIFVVSCGKKGEEKVDANSHAEVTEGVITIVAAQMTEMAAVKDAAGAEALAEKMPSWKAKMKGYLTAAKALPAPTAGEKAAFLGRMDQTKREVGPAMMAMMMSMSQNPEAKVIGEIIDGVRNDQEMKDATDAITAIYSK